MCYYPSLIQNKKYLPNKKNGGVVDYAKIMSVTFDKRVLTVPVGCGRCIECRKQRAKEWQIRLLEDVRHNTNGKFITLTFSDESIKKLAKEVTQKETKIVIGEKSYVDKNGKQRKRYKYKKVTEEIKLEGYETDNAIATLGVRRFLERWRKEYGKSLRHWFITELGHKGTENVHMHGIVWTDEEAKKLEKHWKYGYIYIGEKNGKKIKNYVTEKTVNYITKYVSKMDFNHQEYKSKIMTSAGIGEGYFLRTDWKTNEYKGEKTKEYYTTRTGHKMNLPIRWRNKIYSDEEREKLWIMKLDKEERWVGGEKVSTKEGYEEYYGVLEHYRRKNERMGYGTNVTDWNRKKYEEDRRNMLTQERIARTNELPEWVTNNKKADWQEEEDWINSL